MANYTQINQFGSVFSEYLGKLPINLFEFARDIIVKVEQRVMSFPRVLHIKLCKCARAVCGGRGG